MTIHITKKTVRNMIGHVNETLAEKGLDWKLVEHHAYGTMDVKKQKVGSSGHWNITPDACTTKRELYNWLRGFLQGLYL